MRRGHRRRPGSKFKTRGHSCVRALLVREINYAEAKAPAALRNLHVAPAYLVRGELYMQLSNEIVKNVQV